MVICAINEESLLSDAYNSSSAICVRQLECCRENKLQYHISLGLVATFKAFPLIHR